MGRLSTRLRVRVSPGSRRVGVPRRSVALVSGHGAREKVVELEGVEPAEVERRLEGASA
jgi:uncharacterized protein YggU (UPF0235/DUF167 family)